MAIVPTAGTGSFRDDEDPDRGARAVFGRIRSEQAPSRAPAVPAPEPEVRDRDAGARAVFGRIREREVDARMALPDDVKADPDKAARARRAARFTGASPLAIERNMPAWELEQAVNAVDQSMRDSPRMRGWFSRQGNARVSHDDVDALKSVASTYDNAEQGGWLSWMGDQLSYLFTTRVGVDVNEGQISIASDAAQRRATGATGGNRDVFARMGSFKADAGQEEDIFDRLGSLLERGNAAIEEGLLNAIAQTTGSPRARRAAEAINRGVTTAPVAGATTWNDVKANPLRVGGYIVDATAESLPYMGLAAVPYVGLPLAGTAQTGNIAAEREVNNGGRRSDANIWDFVTAAPYGVTSAVLDRIGVEAIFAGAGRSAVRRIGGAAAGEGATEFLQGNVEYAGGTVGTQAGYDWREGLDQGFAGLVAGAPAGGAIRAGQEITMAAGTRMVQYAQARAGERLVDDVFKGAANSKLRLRDPELFAEFLAEQARGTPAENLYVDGDVLRSLFQDEQGNPLEPPGTVEWTDMLPDFWEQLSQANATGGDVVIPMSRAAAFLAGTPEWEIIKGASRVAPGGLSPNEARGLESDWADVIEQMGQRAYADARADIEAEGPRSRVYDAVLSQARQAGFSLNASRAYADLWADRYTARANYLGGGTDAWSLFEESVAGIRQDTPSPAQTYRRGDGMDVLINAMRGSAQEMQAAGEGLIDRLIRGGGVVDAGGDIRSMGGDRVRKGGYFGRPEQRLIASPDESGNYDMALDLDTWAQTLWDEGYFGPREDRPDVNELLDLIGSALRGDPVVPFGSNTAAIEANNAIVTAADDLRNILENAGLDPMTASREEIERAVDAYQAADGAAFGFDQLRDDVGWSPERIRDLLSTYAYGEDDPTRTKALAAMIDPEQFLGLTVPDGFGERFEAQVTPLDPERLAAEIQPIYLVVEEKDGALQVIGHEGRHRMAAMRDAGIRSAPVVIRFQQGAERERLESARLLGQEFEDSDALLDETEVVGLEPISRANRDVLGARFGAGRFLFQSTSDGKPLVTVHNLSADNFRNAEEIGGLAAPSIAVIRADLGFDNFGEITLIAKPDMIDPRNGRGARAFNADVYSPRQPRAQFDLYGPTLKKLREDLAPIAEELGESFDSDLDTDKLAREGLSAIENSPMARLAYLRSIGQSVKPVRDEKPKVDPRLVKFAKRKGVNSWQDLMLSKEFEAAAVEVEREAFDYWTAEETDPERLRRFVLRSFTIDDDGNINGLSDQFIRQYARDAWAATQPRPVNRYKTREAIEKKIKATAKREGEFRRWVQENYAGLIYGRYFEARDSGRRREYTMDNLVREMTRTIRDGEGWSYGLGSLRSNVAKQFRSLAEIKADRDAIVSDPEMEAVKKEVGAEMFALAERFAPYHRSGKDFGFHDIFSEFLKDLARGSPSALREWQTSIFIEPVPDEMIAEAREFLGKLRDLPTEYFEVKMQRAVGFDEFAAAVVPADLDRETVNRLRSYGLAIETYERGQSRSEAIMRAANAPAARALFQSSALPETIDIGGIQRPTRNSEGQPLARDAAGVMAFWAWFGDSKVVDDQGRPLVVYHGTNKAFDGFARGAWVAGNAALAGEFTQGRRGNPSKVDGNQIYPLYAAISNPVDLSGVDVHALVTPREFAAKVGVDYDALDRRARELAQPDYEASKLIKGDPDRAFMGPLGVFGIAADPEKASQDQRADPLWTYLDRPGVRQALIEITGADGIASKEMMTRRGSDPVLGSTWYAFEPTQLKSINNAGAFDAADPRILNQEGARGRIDFMANGRAMITLFEGRDMSTLLHEGAHLWLEELRADARSLRSGSVFADWETIKAWMKRETGQDVLDDQPIPTDAHELFARAMERYFMEGKAPSESLRRAFASFRAWLVRIYKRVTGLNANLDDEVRQVFDRLIATEDAIRFAQSESGDRALFAEASAAGMTEAEFKAYSDLVNESRTEAYDNLLRKTMERVRIERTKEAKEKRARIRLEVEREISARAEWQAFDLIRGTGDVHMPLGKEGVIARIGRDAIELLPPSRPGFPTVTADGIDPDLIAERAGFATGQQMLEALVGIGVRRKQLLEAGDRRTVLQEAIDVETDRRMTEEYGDILSDGTIEEEALEIIHTNAGSARLAAEVRQLAKQAGEAPTPEDAIRSWAERIVGEAKIVDQASGAAVDRHRRAATKAGRAAEQAYLNGDFAEAFRQKQRQQIANALFIASRTARDRVEVIGRRLDRYSKSRGYKGMAPEYLDRIHELLEQYDLRKRSEEMLKERERFDVWAARQRDMGIEVTIPERLTLAGDQHFTRMTYDEILALDDAVESLANLGRQKMRLKLDKEERDLEEMVGQAVQNAAGLPLRKFSAERNAPRDLPKELNASLVKMEFVADYLDDRDPNGVFNEVLVKGATKAANRLEELQRDVLDPLAKLYLDMPAKERRRFAERISVPEFVSVDPETFERKATVFLRSELIAVALNVGNKSNLEKMLVGETRALEALLGEREAMAYAWTEEKVMAVLNRHLSESDWAFVESVWERVNSLWPSIVEAERELTGMTPEKVEGRPVETRFGTIQGGYYPVVYDPNRSQMAANNADQEAADIFGAIGRFVGTPKGHTISRTSAAMPLTFSLERVLFSHVKKVSTRIAYGRYVRDVMKFSGHPKIRKLFEDHLGMEYHQQIKPWLKEQIQDASMDLKHLAALDRILRQFRVNMTMVGLGFRATTMMAQIAGWHNAQAEIGTKWLLRGMKAMARDMGSIRSFVFERSGEMMSRAQSFDRDVRLFYQQAAEGGRREGNGLMDKAARLADAAGVPKIQAAAFWGIGMIDVYMVAMPTWLGGYYKALDAGMSEGEAIAAADKAVRKSQSAGRSKDLSAVQRGPEGIRVLTTFYSYFNVLYNKQFETLSLVKRGNEAGRRGDKAMKFDHWRQAAMNVWWIMLIAPVTSALLTMDVPEEEEQDLEGWTAWAMHRIFFGLWAGVPGIRDVASGIQREIEGKFVGNVQSPFFTAFDAAERPIKDLFAVLQGDEPSERWIKNAIVAPGYFLGLPTGQLGTTVQYLADVAEGDQNPEGAGDVVKGVIKGPQEDQE